MYLGRDLPPAQDQSARILGFDLANLLASGETISAITSRLRLVSGTDPLPGDLLPVPPQFSGAQVSQLVSLNDPVEGLVGNVYALSFAVSTSAGQIMGAWSRFQVTPGYGVTTYLGGSPPSSAQSIILTASPLYYTLPTLMGGYVGQNWPDANQGERLSYGLDFAPALSPGETIISATSFLALLDGVDTAVTASPNAHDNGSVVISGSTVSRMLAWPGGSALVGNVYALILTGVTSFSQSLTAWSRITIDRVG